MPILTLILSLSTVIWLYLSFFWGRKFFSNEPYFWSNEIVFKPINVELKNKKLEKITVIIPARNEELKISKTISKLVMQKNVNLRIIIVDDNSTDKTKKAAVNIFKKYSYKNFKIINGKELPNEWSGKIWALEQGIKFVMNEKKSQYVLLLDADISLNDNVLYNLIKKLKGENLSMISLMAKLNCKSFWEKLLIPAFIFFFQKLYPFNRVNQNSSGVAAAAGGCILLKSKLLEKNNFFYQIKNKIIDDCNLAKLIKKKKFGIWLGLTNSIQSEREYNKLKEIWIMVSRTAFEQLNNSILNLILVSLGMITLYLLFPATIIFSLIKFNWLNLAISFFGFFLICFIYYPVIKFYAQPKVYAFTLPLAGFIYFLITINSAFNYFSGLGNSWKERSYK